MTHGARSLSPTSARIPTRESYSSILHCGRFVEADCVPPPPPSPGVVECRSLSFDKFHGRFYCKSELRAQRQDIMPLHLLHNDYLVFGDPMHVCFLSAPTTVKPLGKASLAEVPVRS